MVRRTYHTLDNGNRPFKVIIDYDTHKAVVEYSEPEFPKPRQFKFTKAFTAGNGNSILLEVAECEYIFVGHMVYKFSTKEPITKYKSPIGRSQIPYPWAISKKYIYFMLNETYAKRSDVLTKDPYYHSYDDGNKYPKLTEHKFEKKTVFKRIFPP